MSAYARVLSELYALSTRGIEPGLDRVRGALRRAGSPERDLRVVHVAGTNGKGSVSAMVATGLAVRGQRVGLFTSPHLATFTERMRVLGGEPIDRGDVVRAWDALREPLIGEGAPRITFFEATTVMALWLYRERGVDAVVLEVGLGGRLDATNVFERPLACAITRIGIDHTRFLGDDIASIAFEKAGILKRGVPAIIGPQRAEAMEVVEREAARIGAPLVRLDSEITGDQLRIAMADREAVVRPRLAGAHQRDNAAVAAGVLWTLEDEGFAVDVRAAIEDVSWPGRLERVEANGARFLFDAAHNADGCETLAAHLASEQPRRRRVLVFGAMADKDWRAMLAILRPHVDAVVAAAPELARAERPEVIAEHAAGRASSSIADALATARELAEGGEIIVAGSIYLMGAARALVLGIPMDPPIAM